MFKLPLESIVGTQLCMLKAPLNELNIILGNYKNKCYIRNGLSDNKDIVIHLIFLGTTNN